MYESYTLPKALPWIPGESILGLLVRNALPHGYSDPLRLLKRTFPDTRELSALGARDLNGHERDAFSCLLGMSRADFDLMHHGSNLRLTRNLFGHPVHENLVGLSVRTVCPLCLRESPHHRGIWDLPLHTACPKHAVLMVDRCPRCKALLTWSTPSVGTCSNRRCRHPLAGIDPDPVEPAETEGIANIVGLVIGDRPGVTPSMTVNDTIRRVLDLGVFAIGKRGARRPVGFSRKRPIETMRIMNAGWSVLANWPAGFRALIDALRVEAPGRDGRYGVRKEFGTLPTWLDERAAEPDLAHLVAEFRDYTGRLSALSTRAPSVLRYRATSGLNTEVITDSEAAGIVGLEHSRLSKLADEHDLWVVAPTGSGAPSLLDSRKFALIVERISRTLTKADAAEILNISKGAFQAFQNSRLLRPIRSEVRILPERIYRAEDLSILLDALAAKAEFKTPPEGCGELLTISALARCGATIGEIVQGVFEGKLRPYAIDVKERGLGRFLFKPVWVHRLLHPDRHVGVDTAAAVLGVKQEVAYHFLRCGLLHAIPGSSRFDGEAIDAFQAEYITGTEIAAKHGLRARWVSVKLVELGVEPVCAPQVDGCRQYLFRRADLETVDPADLVGPRGKLRLKGQDEDSDED